MCTPAERDGANKPRDFGWSFGSNFEQHAASERLGASGVRVSWYLTITLFKII